MSAQYPRDRYLNDPLYKAVVDQMEYLLHTAQLTPSEMREAAVLASINYENMNVRRYHIALTPELHQTLEEMHMLVTQAVEDKNERV